MILETPSSGAKSSIYVAGQNIKKSPGKKAREIKLINFTKVIFLNIFHENKVEIFREIAFLAVLNFSPVKKHIFCHF